MSKVVVKGPSLEEIAKTVTTEITQQMERRSYLAANELRNSSLLVLRGQRSGRRYTVPGTGRVKYNKRNKTATITYKKSPASAPGEPPAVRTGAFRLSWKPSAHKILGSYISRIESDARTDNGRHNLGEILENGTGRMAPRPHHERIMKHAEPKILKIYDQPYF